MSVDGITGGTLSYSDGNNDKMVKKVIDYKLLNGKRYYKVKWECTWELEDSLFSCQSLVDQFWNFVNRVKFEDNRITGKKKPQLTESIVDINNENNEKENCLEDVPCVHICHEDKSKPDELEYPQKQKLENYHLNDDLIRKTLVNSKPVSRAENMLDENNIPNLPSMVTINPPRQELQIPHSNNGVGTPGLPQHPSSVFKRTYGIMDHNTEEDFKKSPEIIDLKLQRQHLNGICSEERRFQCHVCGMAFKRKDMCKRHLRTHTNDCCYFCSICKKGFIRRYVLVKHLNKDHQTNDQTKILSTKRRRRDDVKQQPLSKHEIISKNESHCMDSISSGPSEYVIDAAESLSIDDEHDYDKKTEDLVIVFKVESDNTKIDSTINTRTCEYTEKKSVDSNVDLLVDPLEQNEESRSTIAVIAPLNGQPEHNVDVNISSDNHQPEKSVGDGTYVMVSSRSDISLPNNLQNTNIPYNTQFCVKETNQSFSQHE